MVHGKRSEKSLGLEESKIVSNHPTTIFEGRAVKLRGGWLMLTMVSSQVGQVSSSNAGFW